MKILIIAESHDKDDLELHTLNEISANDYMDRIKKIAKAIATCPEWYNWNTQDNGDKGPFELYVESELITVDEYDWFDDLLPYAEYGIHTIKNIYIIDIVEQLL